MQPKVRDLLIAVLMVVGIGGYVYAQKQAAPSPMGTATTTPNAVDQVAAHGTRESCWTIINGSVYDLTSWIPQHPGGEEAILMLCGTDGSAAFNGQHGGAARQETILAGFKIGESGTVAPTDQAPITEPGDDSGRNRRGRDDNDE